MWSLLYVKKVRILRISCWMRNYCGDFCHRLITLMQKCKNIKIICSDFAIEEKIGIYGVQKGLFSFVAHKVNILVN